jgi:hypothetical protein
VAIVVDPDGSTAAMESETVKRLRREGRAVLALDVFQTGAAKAPRDREDTQPVNGMDATDAERRATMAAGGPKFLTYNVSDDAARVQDIVTALVYARGNGRAVEIYARGDAALWATFAAAVSGMPVALHLDAVPKMATDEDYLLHFNVPGILRAGGLPVAERLANGR